MKAFIVIILAGAGAGVFLAHSLSTSGYSDQTDSAQEIIQPKIKASSVAGHCVKAIPAIWDHAREAGEEVDTLKAKVAYAAFEHAATNYCLCNQEWLGKNRTASEKTFFGKLAGQNLKMQFAGSFTKERRAAIRMDVETISRRHKTVLERKPKWLKEINKTFRTCRKEQSLRKVMSSLGLN